MLQEYSTQADEVLAMEYLPQLARCCRVLYPELTQINPFDLELARGQAPERRAAA